MTKRRRMTKRRPDEKARRCKEAKCPLAGKRDTRCAGCTGPVVWTDGDGKVCGRPRSCHNCPMDGLGLPVCWACCPGPNEGFATDGQSLVTTDGMEAPSEFIARNAQTGTPRRAESVTATLTLADENRAMSVLRRISNLDGRGWQAFVRAFTEGGIGGRRAAARMIGASRGTFDAESSPQNRLVAALAKFDAEDFCVLRQRMADMNCSWTAATMFVTKQAVSKREKRMRIKAAWYGAFLAGRSEREDETDGERFSVTEGVITPNGKKGSADWEPNTVHKNNQSARPPARASNSRTKYHKSKNLSSF